MKVPHLSSLSVVFCFYCNHKRTKKNFRVWGGEENIAGKNTVILHKLCMCTKKIRIPSGESKELCLGPWSGIVTNVFETIAFFLTSIFFLFNDAVPCNCKDEKVMLFLTAVPEREFLMSVRNTETSSVMHVSYTTVWGQWNLTCAFKCGFSSSLRGGFWIQSLSSWLISTKSF